MPTIEFTDRATFKRLVLECLPNTVACISISSDVVDLKEMQSLLKSNRDKNLSLCLQFLDVDDRSSGFTDRTAELISAVVDPWMTGSHEQRPSTILIHCDMGVSRSGAVAKWINDYYGLDQRYLNEYYQYNRYVYDTLMSACGVSLKDWYRDLEEQNVN